MQTLLGLLIIGMLLLTGCGETASTANDGRKQSTDKTTESTDDTSDDDTSGDDTPGDDDETEAGVPTVQITSHTDAQELTGNGLITLQGTLAGDSTIVKVEVTHNGVATAADSFSQTAFSHELQLSGWFNTVRVTVEDEAGKTASADLTLEYAFYAFTNGQAAEFVIGQPDFETKTTGRSATKMNEPQGKSAVANDILYVPDRYNHRVLGYYGIPSTNGVAADFVLGQTDFVSNNWGNSQSRLSQPGSISISGSKMALADSANGRVLIWNQLPTTTGALPDVVIGRSDFDSTISGCSASLLSNIVWGVTLDSGRLIVSDLSNHRVLIWNSVPVTSGTAADLVLGQSTMDSCASGLGASKMNGPAGVWTDGTRLAVADSENRRVLIWNTFPTVNGQAADVVLGQANMDENMSYMQTQSTFEYPLFVESTGTQLFVGTCGTRVLGWDAFPTANSAPADRVLGEPNFTSRNATATKESMYCPTGMLLHGRQLFVSDSKNNRVAVFRAP